MDLASSLNEFVRAQKSNDQTIHDERLKEFKSFLEREFQACFPPIKKSTTREEKEEDELGFQMTPVSSAKKTNRYRSSRNRTKNTRKSWTMNKRNF